jgi:hypothetical protein
MTEVDAANAARLDRIFDDIAAGFTAAEQDAVERLYRHGFEKGDEMRKRDAILAVSSLKIGGFVITREDR